MDARVARARWTPRGVDASVERARSGDARSSDAGDAREDEEDDEWVVVRAPARRDDDDDDDDDARGLASDEAEDGGDDDDVEAVEGEASGTRAMDAMDAMDATAAETPRTTTPLPREEAARADHEAVFALVQKYTDLDPCARLARRASVREDAETSANNDDDDDDDDDSSDSSSQTEYGEDSDAEDDDAVEAISKSDVDIQDSAFDRLRLKAIEAYRELEKRINRVARDGAEAIAPLSRDLWDRLVRCTRRMARRKFDLQKEASSLTDVIVVVTASGIAFIVARKCFSALMARSDRAERAARSARACDIDLARCWHDAATYGYFV